MTSPALDGLPRSSPRGIAARWKYWVNTVPLRWEMRTNWPPRSGFALALHAVDDAVVDGMHVLAPDLAAEIDAAVAVAAFDGAVSRALGAEHPAVAPGHPANRAGQRVNPGVPAQRREQARLRRGPVGPEPSRRQVRPPLARARPSPGPPAPVALALRVAQARPQADADSRATSSRGGESRAGSGVLRAWPRQGTGRNRTGEPTTAGPVRSAGRRADPPHHADRGAVDRVWRVGHRAAPASLVYRSVSLAAVPPFSPG